MVKRTIWWFRGEGQGDTERYLRKNLKEARSSSGKFKVPKKTVKASTFTGRNETTGQPRQQTSKYNYNSW